MNAISRMSPPQVGHARPAEAGFDVRPLPAGWTAEQEKMPGKPLTADDVGPPWVIALRQAGGFTVEDAAAEPAAASKKAGETKAEKKARKAREKAAGK